ncbi:tetratricopeptide repeat protein [Riemerella columbina]|uniref:tetratricopeptide repeat protein n=1 Tax=Riemerella columbina TaxID=103810 RepID=UPI00266EC9F5|nr:tetratricopeptide repeat protein [Riemerella columbina]WKS95216.1 tetratricopeptide repeat protein [Riemerella columbina]
MSKKYNQLSKEQIKEGKETVEIFEELDQSALKSEKFIERYAKQLMIGFGVVLLAILGYFAYQQFVIAPKNQEATMAYLSAQKAQSLGDDAKALGGKSSANPGFLGTYEEFGATKAGKLSAYNAGLIKYKEGKYQEAYDLIDAFKSDNKILMAIKYGAMGDCLANLNKAEDAMAQYDKASSTSEDPFTSYYFTRKAGIMALALKKNTDAKKYFETIDEKYQDYDGGASAAYIEMVKYY